MTKACVIGIFFAMVFSTVVALSPEQIPSAEAQSPDINLIGQQTIWQPFAAAVIDQNQSSLDILVITNFTEKLYNRAYLPILITTSTNDPVIFSLNYMSKSYLGNATFFAEIRDNRTGEILWESPLNNTDEQLFNQNFSLPDTILNKPVEFRIYAITDGPGQHALSLEKAVLSFTNVRQPIKVETTDLVGQ